MSFSASSRNIAYNTDTGILSAECSTPDGRWVTSLLNINNCLAIRGIGGIKPFEGPGRYSGDLPLINYKEDHLRRTATFSGTTISMKEEWEKNKSTTRWDMLWYGNQWTGEWRETTCQVDLNDYVRNKDGLLEFVSEDHEPSALTKWIIWALNKIPAPNTSAIVISIAIDDKKAKDEFAQRSKDQEEWLKKTYLDGKNRIVPGVLVEP
ncbi:hypothetical protein PM082_020405 [Marasmius tenuissimus]|nr:hypothetical protein PM082_020405 [Marasmius tenuissimus]